MTGVRNVICDERTVVVEDASYRFAYGFITFALLLDVIYRSLVRQEAPWDLLAIVIVGGVGSILYQWKRTLPGRSFKRLAGFLVVTGVVAALIAIAAARFLR
jgi:uncharacterized membrane protein YeaQ/YmgE (transglycosylase-associated protein family)